MQFLTCRLGISPKPRFMPGTSAKFLCLLPGFQRNCLPLFKKLSRGDGRGQKIICRIATRVDDSCGTRGCRLDHGCGGAGQRAIVAPRNLDHESAASGGARRGRRGRVRRQAARNRRFGGRRRRDVSRRIRSGDKLVASPCAAARRPRSSRGRSCGQQDLCLRRICRLGAQGCRHRRFRIRSGQRHLENAAADERAARFGRRGHHRWQDPRDRRSRSR